MFIVLALLLYAVTSAHEITKLLVPLIADPRRAAELSCHFKMDEQKLHSVKWYKNMDEIFRYNPTQKPPIRLFNVTGTMIQGGGCHEEVCLVRLMPQPLASTAFYTCEVSTEGPKFQIVRASKQMTVVAMPERDPVIIGARAIVKPGEDILVNCSSDYSLPHSDIRWYVNGNMQMPDAWHRTELSPPIPGGLRASWRVIRVRVRESASGALRLRCEAFIPLAPPVVKETTVVLSVHSKTELSKFVASRGYTHHSLAVLLKLLLLREIISNFR